MTNPVRTHARIQDLREKIEAGTFKVGPKEAPSIQERLDLEREKLEALRSRIEETLGLRSLDLESRDRLWAWATSVAGRGGPKEVLGIYVDLAPTLIEIAEKGVGYVVEEDRAFARGYRLGAHDAADAILEHATPEVEAQIHRLAQVVRDLANFAPREGADEGEQ